MEAHFLLQTYEGPANDYSVASDFSMQQFPTMNMNRSRCGRTINHSTTHTSLKSLPYDYRKSLTRIAEVENKQQEGSKTIHSRTTNPQSRSRKANKCWIFHKSCATHEVSSKNFPISTRGTTRRLNQVDGHSSKIRKQSDSTTTLTKHFSGSAFVFLEPSTARRQNSVLSWNPAGAK